VGGQSDDGAPPSGRSTPVDASRIGDEGGVYSFEIEA
jgi:hypothetical protein